MSSIPQNLVQCTFDFSALDLQPIDDIVLQVNDVPPDKKFCPVCKQWLDRDCFGKQSSNKKDGLRYFCKSCRHNRYVADLEKDPEYNKKSAQRQRELFLEKTPEEQRAILDRHNQSQNARRAKRDPNICSGCLSRPVEPGHLCDECCSRSREYHRKNRDREYQSGKQSRDRLRDQIISTYGGVCVNCGECNPAFLSVDHVNNNGSEHRRAGLRGYKLYLWLRKNNFPREGFQLLCQNCNWLKNILTLLSNRPDPTSEKVKYCRFWREDLRNEVLTAYGSKCACCDEDRPEVLTIDHVNGGGNDHRREVGGGIIFYSWLRKQGFPQDEYQLLCRNCNFAKYVHGICPHQS